MIVTDCKPLVSILNNRQLDEIGSD